MLTSYREVGANYERLSVFPLQPFKQNSRELWILKLINRENNCKSSNILERGRQDKQTIADYCWSLNRDGNIEYS